MYYVASRVGAWIETTCITYGRMPVAPPFSGGATGFFLSLDKNYFPYILGKKILEKGVNPCLEYVCAWEANTPVSRDQK